MPCNASYARFIFGKFFASTIILYILLFAQNFYSCKKWVLHETKIKEKQNKTIPDSNSNLTKSMTHHNQTKELTTWFLSHQSPKRG
jgi:hypothetical protein